MSLHPLAGVVEKLRNANEHIHRLQDATLLYLNSGPNAAIVSERDASDSTRGRLCFKVLRQPPLKIAAIAGGAVHNIRSALDYFIEELVKGNGHTPGFQHRFPICAARLRETVGGSQPRPTLRDCRAPSARLKGSNRIR